MEIIHGDCLDVMRGMEPESVDAVVTDPPYDLTNRTVDVQGCEQCGRTLGGRDGHPALCPRCGGSLSRQRPSQGRGFMGKEWDSTAIAFNPETWMECLRVLKPGGHLLAFGGTRTSHRMVCAIEDAGFEIRDSIHWIYAQGFPKSHNLSGERRGYGTALKPAHEPIVVARKPLIGTVSANVLTHGTGALNIDATRVGLQGVERHTTGATPDFGNHGIYGEAHGHRDFNADIPRYNNAGRWPANIVFTHALDCEDDCAPDCPVAELDRQSVDRGIHAAGSARPAKDRVGDKGLFGVGGGQGHRFGDSGGASRFFPVFRYEAKASRKDRGDGNSHPTVKPTALMQWLVRLITPPGGIVLDPFCGSGSTLVAALREGFDAIGIERESEYVEIARKRLDNIQPTLELTA